MDQSSSRASSPAAASGHHNGTDKNMQSPPTIVKGKSEAPAGATAASSTASPSVPAGTFTPGQPPSGSSVDTSGTVNTGATRTSIASAPSNEEYKKGRDDKRAASGSEAQVPRRLSFLSNLGMLADACEEREQQEPKAASAPPAKPSAPSSPSASSTAPSASAVTATTASSKPRGPMIRTAVAAGIVESKSGKRQRIVVSPSTEGSPSPATPSSPSPPPLLTMLSQPPATSAYRPLTRYTFGFGAHSAAVSLTRRLQAEKSLSQVSTLPSSQSELSHWCPLTVSDLGELSKEEDELATRAYLRLLNARTGTNGRSAAQMLWPRTAATVDFRSLEKSPLSSSSEEEEEEEEDSGMTHLALDDDEVLMEEEGLAALETESAATQSSPSSLDTAFPEWYDRYDASSWWPSMTSELKRFEKAKAATPAISRSIAAGAPIDLASSVEGAANPLAPAPITAPRLRYHLRLTPHGFQPSPVEEQQTAAAAATDVASPASLAGSPGSQTAMGQRRFVARFGEGLRNAFTEARILQTSPNSPSEQTRQPLSFLKPSER